MCPRIKLAKIDTFVKSRKIPFPVIPACLCVARRQAEAGIQLYQMFTACLDSGFHRSDDFLRVNQN